MLIGIVSDSHDNVPMLRSAVEHFNHAGCELVIHAGDIISPFAMALFEQLSCPFKAVYGNNDGEKVGLKLKAVAVGGSIDTPPLDFEAGGLRIRVLHDCGDWEAEAAKSGADIVIFGHTHQVVVETGEGAEPPIGINPGECGGWLGGKCTAAILDTRNRQVRLIDLNLEPGEEIDC